MAAILIVCGMIMPFWLCVLCVIPLILDGGIQLLFGILSNNTRRFVTGILFGVGIIQAIAAGIKYIFM